MILKIVAGVFVVAICSLVGVKIAEKKKVKRDIFSEFIVFCNNFICNVSLFEKSVLEQIDEADGELKKTLFGAKESLKNGEKFYCVDDRLNANEKEIVENVINSLGKGDVESQKITIEMYVERLKSIYLSQKEDYQKFSQLYLKLGFSCGLIIMVLIV